MPTYVNCDLDALMYLDFQAVKMNMVDKLHQVYWLCAFVFWDIPLFLCLSNHTTSF